MLEIVLSQIVSGLVLGGLYVLIAIGLSIIFGLLGIVNFAHGTFFTLGAYFALTLYQYFGWPAVILAPVFVGAIGMVAERLLIRRLYDKEPLISLIVTFALALLIEASVRLIYGGIGQPFSPPPFLTRLPDLGADPDHQVPLRRAWSRPRPCCSALWLFLENTPFGRILRAGSRDPEMVGLLGINLPRVLTWVFGLGCAISGIAGVLAAPLWTITPAMATNAIMPAFVVVAIGGLGSFAGAVIAGPAGRRRDRADHPVLPAGLRRGDVSVHGADAAAATARPAGRAVGALRMINALRHPVLLVVAVLRRADRAVAADRRADQPDHADRDLHAVWRRRLHAGQLHRPGAVRRLGLLRLRQLCRRVRHAARRARTRSWR